MIGINQNCPGPWDGCSSHLNVKPQTLNTALSAFTNDVLESAEEEGSGVRQNWVLTLTSITHIPCFPISKMRSIPSPLGHHEV